MLCRREPCHVLHQSQDGHIDLLVLVHVDTLACVSQSHLLGRAHDDGPRDGQRLHEGEVDVAGAGRRVEDEVVEFTPVGIPDELLEGVAGHASAPQCSLFGVDEEADAQHLDAILLDGDDEVAPLDVLAVGTCVLYLEHLGYGGTEDVAVQQSHPVPQTGQRDSQVGGHGALAHASLAAAHGDDVLHSRQQVGQVRTRCLQALGLDFHLSILGGKGMNGSLAGLDDGLDEGVGGLVEDEGEADVQAADAQVVLHHLHLHDVLARARVAYRGQGIHDEFGIE